MPQVIMDGKGSPSSSRADSQGGGPAFARVGLVGVSSALPARATGVDGTPSTAAAGSVEASFGASAL